MKKQHCALCINWATCHCQQYEIVECCHGNNNGFPLHFCQTI